MRLSSETGHYGQLLEKLVDSFFKHLSKEDSNAAIEDSNAAIRSLIKIVSSPFFEDQTDSPADLQSLSATLQALQMGMNAAAVIPNVSQSQKRWANLTSYAITVEKGLSQNQDSLHDWLLEATSSEVLNTHANTIGTWLDTFEKSLSVKSQHDWLVEALSSEVLHQHRDQIIAWLIDAVIRNYLGSTIDHQGKSNNAYHKRLNALKYLLIKPNKTPYAPQRVFLKGMLETKWQEVVKVSIERYTQAPVENTLLKQPLRNTLDDKMLGDEGRCAFAMAIQKLGLFASDIEEVLLRLLTHVTRGEEAQAEKLVQRNPELLLRKGSVTDFTGRTFKNVSVLQMAWWTGDWYMVDMLLRNCPPELLRKAIAQLEAIQTIGVNYDMVVDLKLDLPGNLSNEEFCKIIAERGEVLLDHGTPVICRGLDMVLMSLDQEVILDENQFRALQTISAEHDNQPILLRHGDEVYLYGCKSGDWRLNKITTPEFKNFPYQQEQKSVYCPMENNYGYTSKVNTSLTDAMRRELGAYHDLVKYKLSHIKTNDTANGRTYSVSVSVSGERRYNYQPLIQALSRYLERYSDWQKSDYEDETIEQDIDRLWQKVVGLVQRTITAFIINQYCHPKRSFEGVKFNEETMERETSYNNCTVDRKEDWLALADNLGVRLGISRGRAGMQAFGAGWGDKARAAGEADKLAIRCLGRETVARLSAVFNHYKTELERLEATSSHRH